jgi:hypothetical protein
MACTLHRLGSPHCLPVLRSCRVEPLAGRPASPSLPSVLPRTGRRACRGERDEKAIISVIATSYLLGVSTRRMEELVEQLGITRLSTSQVSVMAKELDEHVESFRTRPLDAGPYTLIAADALTMKVREGGRVVVDHVLIATGVNADGHREILGVELASAAESAAGWLKLFRGLAASGLSGVALVTSDAHTRLVAAMHATLDGASERSDRARTGGHDTSTHLIESARQGSRGSRRRAPSHGTWPSRDFVDIGLTRVPDRAVAKRE